MSIQLLHFQPSHPLHDVALQNVLPISWVWNMLMSGFAMSDFTSYSLMKLCPIHKLKANVYRQNII
jgi:hypothetical protein